MNIYRFLLDICGCNLYNKYHIFKKEFRRYG